MIYNIINFFSTPSIELYLTITIPLAAGSLAWVIFLANVAVKSIINDLKR